MKDRLQKVVKRLLRATNNGEIQWETRSPTEVNLPEELRGTPDEPVYVAQYKGRNVLLVNMEVKKTMGTIGAQDTTQPSWQTTLKGIAAAGGSYTDTVTRMAIENPNTGGIWAFPTSNLLSDLMSAAQKQSSGVTEWVNDVIEDEDQH